MDTEDTTDLAHMAMARSGRARYNSKCRETNDRKTKGIAAVAINFGHKLM